MSAATERPTSHLFAVAAISAGIAALLVVRLSSFGIWDPWELETADAARRLADGDLAGRVSLSARLASWGFAAFGIQEWAGRLPIALAGVLLLPLTYLLLARHGNPRAGVYAALVAGTCPLFLFNARPMLGEAPAFLVHALVGLGVAELLFVGRHSDPLAVLARLLSLAAGIALATVTCGMLLGALPPVVAGAAVVVVRRRSGPSGGQRLADAALLAAALLCCAGVAQAVRLDAAGYSPWTGGHPMSITPPNFDRWLARIFHAFAPWSALLPLALAHMTLAPFGEVATPVGGAAAADDDRGPRSFMLLWIAAAAGAHTLFASRYGETSTFLALAPLAACVGIFLADLQRDGRSQWPAALGCAFLVGLLIRDFALYPDGPAQGMPVKDIEIPEVFNPRRQWAALLGAFGICAALALGLGSGRRPAHAAAPYRLARDQWRRGPGDRIWLGAFAALGGGLLVLGALAWLAPNVLHLSVLGTRVARGAGVVVVALPVAVLALQWAVDLWTRLNRLRLVPLLGCGVLIAGYASHGYLPALSGHFSPREVYESFNRLAQPGQALAEYQVGGRAAAYYAHGEVVEIGQLSALIDYLTQPGPRWAAFSREELPNIDRQFRLKTGEHLFVADARSAHVVLACNQRVPGTQDQNPITPFVRSEVPAIQHPVSANLDDKLEFLGYDLKLPHDSHVGASESFGILWYFRVKERIPGSYKMFVHIDGAGQRIHGDHEPVHEQYPVRMWEPGDIIVDEQQLDVPGNFRADDYTIFMGFYSGNTRLPVKDGPADADNRIRAGVLRIR